MPELFVLVKNNTIIIHFVAEKIISNWLVICVLQIRMLVSSWLSKSLVLLSLKGTQRFFYRI